MLQINTYIYVRFDPKQWASEIAMDEIDRLKTAEPYINFDFEELEGYIDLSYYGAPILDDRYGDLIYFTWYEMVDAIDSFAKTGRGCAGLWSIPTSICLEQIKNPDFVLLKVDGKGWLLPKNELVTILIDGAVQFYGNMFKVFMRNKKDYHDCLKLKERLIREGII